ncbi:hypothetical protein [Lysobacter sp. CA199]|uniref:hypothetical protein n=1 Tax=Lysobacter sp. CA199 TaxID=3455608 RepID=UPI003F8D7660
MTTPADHPEQTLSNGLPPPPIPPRLREMLKDYPKHLERLQDELNEVVEKPYLVTPIFEQMMWALEGCTSAFIRQAQDELEAAQASGDAVAIASAEAKERLMFKARSANGGLGNLEDLRSYLQKYKDVME